MQQGHRNPDTLDRGLNPPIQPRRPKLLAPLRQALCPRHYSRRDESLVQKAVRDAIVRAGLPKRATCHTFRHSFAAHLFEGGYDIRTVQELVGHSDVKTTIIHTHVLNRGPTGIRSPVDGL